MTAESDEPGGAVAKESRLGSRAPAFVRKSAPLHQIWLDPRVRRRNLLLTAAGVIALAGVAGCYLWQYGLDIPWADS
ncbi:hypothetical protein [Actinacidiphila alni]|uniref:hypothetical protein n=1 Tax=Actinacidiphila alni TaxID=380248 RepID=UPI0034514B1C